VEIPLSGGNATTGVVRVGDTVRRPAGPWTPAVHALLDHLRAVGFRGAPRALGIDERGREVLSYLPGPVVHPDHEALLDPADRLARVGRLIRDLHDAVAGFVPPPDARWRVVLPADGASIIAHHDLAPWNLVAGRRWAFIDWDGAGPGTRLGDLAYAAHGFVPLSADPGWRRPEPGRRLRVLVDAYGLDEADRVGLLARLGPRTRSMATFLRAQAALGAQPWTRLYEEGHADAWSADADHVEAHAADWRHALLD
jgi:hypothetical protein